MTAHPQLGKHRNPRGKLASQHDGPMDLTPSCSQAAARHRRTAVASLSCMMPNSQAACVNPQMQGVHVASSCLLPGTHC